jgi:hypothetical protein
MFGSKLGLDAEFQPTSGRLTNGHDVRCRSAAKQFIEPPEQIRREIAALKADKSVSETQKKEVLKELEAALKTTRPIQFKENIALVLKYFDKLQPLMQEQKATDYDRNRTLWMDERMRRHGRRRRIGAAD